MHESEDVGGNVPIYGVARDPSMLGGFGTLNRRAILLGSFWGTAQRGVSCWENVPIFVAVPACVCVCLGKVVGVGKTGPIGQTDVPILSTVVQCWLESIRWWCCFGGRRVTVSDLRWLLLN